MLPVCTRLCPLGEGDENPADAKQMLRGFDTPKASLVSFRESPRLEQKADISISAGVKIDFTLRGMFGYPFDIQMKDATA